MSDQNNPLDPNQNQLDLAAKGVREDILPVIAAEKILEHSIQKPPSATLHDKPSIGTNQPDGGTNAVAFTKKIDPQNSAGSIKFALELVQQLKNRSNSPFTFLQDILGGGLVGQMRTFVQMLQQGMQQEASQLENQIMSALVNKNKKQPAPPKPVIKKEDLVSQATQFSQQSSVENT